ncbi:MULTISPECIES: hypothetical protein [unclassified Streptomyces]|uniref:hypothetical protein n=1 Tax=unclassified Streptomyces TaxID=2593676 RepID=UPI0035DBD65E
MNHPRIPAAQFISRVLPDPYEDRLGGPDPEALHHLLAAVHADFCCPPGGHTVSWRDCYEAGQQRPLPHKAGFLLDGRGEPVPVPAHVRGEAADRAREAQRVAVRIRRASAGMPLGNQG